MLDTLNHGHFFEQQGYAMQEEHWDSHDEYRNHHSNMKIMSVPCLDSQLPKQNVILSGSHATRSDFRHEQKIHQDGWHGQRLHPDAWHGQKMHHNGWQHGSNAHQNHPYGHSSGGKFMSHNGVSPSHLMHGSPSMNNKLMSTQKETFHRVHVPVPPVALFALMVHEHNVHISGPNQSADPSGHLESIFHLNSFYYDSLISQPVISESLFLPVSSCRQNWPNYMLRYLPINLQSLSLTNQPQRKLRKDVLPHP